MKCDVDTFARMYEEIYKDLYRFALCMMKNEQDAEDAVSDAVLSGYENIRKLRDERLLKAGCLQYWRTHVRRNCKIEAESFVWRRIWSRQSRREIILEPDIRIMEYP